MSEARAPIEKAFVVSRVREAVEWICIMGVGAGLSCLLWEKSLSAFLQLWAAGGLGTALVSVLRPRQAVVVSESALTVPVGPWRSTRSLSLADIDRNASASSSSWQRLAGYRVVYDRSGARVYLSCIELGPSNVQRILGLIGCA